MSRERRRRLSIAAAALAAVAAVLVALLAGGGHGTEGKRSAGAVAAAGGREGDLAAAAAYLGLSRRELRRDLRQGQTLAGVAATRSEATEQGLIAAIVAARQALLASELAAGRLTVGEERQRLALTRSQVTREVHGVGALAGGDLAVAGAYLGAPPARLARELRSGGTLAHIAASSPGRSSAGLIDALAAAHRERLEAQVAAGTLTPAAERALLGSLRRRVNAIVNRSHRAVPSPARASGG